MRQLCAVAARDFNSLFRIGVPFSSTCMVADQTWSPDRALQLKDHNVSTRCSCAGDNAISPAKTALQQSR